MNRYSLILTVVMMCGFTQAQAETRYVTDQFKVMMRSGEGVQHKIIRTLPSGTQVEVLSNNSETGYSEVRLDNELTGYILTRQLMDTPSARDRLAVTQAKLNAALEEPKQLKSKLAEANSKLKKLTADFNQLEKTKNKTANELETIRNTAADAIRMAEERIELRKNVADLTHRIEDLKQENRDLSNHNTRNWFLIGAGVIIAGILIGLILPRLHVQRRKDTW